MEGRTNSSASECELGNSFGARQTDFLVALVGREKVGKTALAYRFIDRTTFMD